MNDQLEHDLRHHFNQRTSHLPAAGPGLPAPGAVSVSTITETPRRSTLMLVAATLIVVLAVGGLFALGGRSGSGGVSTSDTGAALQGSDLEPAATLPDTADVSSAPFTVAADEPTDWYRFAPDLDVAWFQSLDGTSPSMFCWRTPVALDGVCTVDAIGTVVVPLVVPTAGGQTLVLAGGDRTEPDLEITLDDGSTATARQDFDDIIDWGVARFAIPADRSIVLVDGQQVAPSNSSDSRTQAESGSLVFAPTTGSEPLLFAYVVSGRGTPTATIDTVNDEGVCLSIDLDEGTAGGCVDPQTVSAGLAYNLFGNPNGGFSVIGVVPDEVDTVEIDGNRVPIVNNVWTAQLESDAPAALRVGNSRTGQFAALPPAEASPTPETTTSAVN